MSKLEHLNVNDDIQIQSLDYFSYNLIYIIMKINKT